MPRLWWNFGWPGVRYTVTTASKEGRVLTGADDDAFGVTVGGWFVEVAEEFLAPEADAFRERVEPRQAGAVDGEQERVESMLGLSGGWPCRCSGTVR